MCDCAGLCASRIFLYNQKIICIKHFFCCCNILLSNGFLAFCNSNCIGSAKKFYINVFFTNTFFLKTSIIYLIEQVTYLKSVCSSLPHGSGQLEVQCSLLLSLGNCAWQTALNFLVLLKKTTEMHEPSKVHMTTFLSETTSCPGRRYIL